MVAGVGAVEGGQAAGDAVRTGSEASREMARDQNQPGCLFKADVVFAEERTEAPSGPVPTLRVNSLFR